MTNYQYRKYEGAPHTEKKRLAPDPPSKLTPRKPHPAPRPEKRIKNLYSIAPRDGRWWWSSPKGSSTPNPHIGYPLGIYQLVSAGEHVVRRLKANLWVDTKLKVYWIEEQATHAQLSPVFHSFNGIANWLLFEGLSRGWLVVETFWSREYTWKGKFYPSEHRAKLDKR